MMSDGFGGFIHLNRAVEGWLLPGRNPFGLYLYREDVAGLASRFVGETIGQPGDKPCRPRGGDAVTRQSAGATPNLSAAKKKRSGAGLRTENSRSTDTRVDEFAVDQDPVEIEDDEFGRIHLLLPSAKPGYEPTDAEAPPAHHHFEQGAVQSCPAPEYGRGR